MYAGNPYKDMLAKYSCIESKPDLYNAFICQNFGDHRGKNKNKNRFTLFFIGYQVFNWFQ